MVRSLRYLKQYYRPAPSVVRAEAGTYVRGGKELPAMIYRPAARKQPGSAWIVLHGLTYHGPRHPGLIRFASALAAAGHLVLIPEIEEWSRLLVAPELTQPTIQASARTLLERADVDPARIGVFGFSFGATQALIAAHDEELVQHIRVIVAWGGYADIARLVHFGLTGEHGFDGVRELTEPDPYGRWIFGANYLTSVPGYADMSRVADALIQLAREAGRTHTFAGDPVHNPLKKRLAGELNDRERTVFDLFAPVETHDMPAARVLAKALAETIVAQDALMDPAPYLDRVRIPVILAHGRDDRLVPYTETLLLRRRLPAALLEACTITSLFAHSSGNKLGLGPIGLVRETGRFLAMLNGMLTAL